MSKQRDTPKLTRRQKLFVRHVRATGKPYTAARLAGYTGSRGSRLLRSRAVVAVLGDLQESKEIRFAEALIKQRLRLDGGSQRAAGKAIGLRPASANEWSRRPEIQQRMRELVRGGSS